MEIPTWRPALKLCFQSLSSQGLGKRINVKKLTMIWMRWRLNRQPPSPEEKVVETMSMPRASIFASTGDTLTSINIMTKPKVEKKEEKTSITISRPTTGNKSGPWSKQI